MTSKAIERKQSIKSKLQEYSPEIAMALPKGMDADRMRRIVMTEVSKNPKLLECTVESLFGAIIQSAQLGLEPGVLGEAYFVPYGNKVQFIPGYKGLMALARRSGEVKSIRAYAIKENDNFSYGYGDSPYINHTPAEKERGATIGAYAVAIMENTLKEFEVMFKEDIEDIRKRSKSSGNGPWKTDYDEMCKKTVVKKLIKYLPVSTEAKQAVAFVELADAGQSQQNELLVAPNTAIEAAIVVEEGATKTETVKAKLTASVPEVEAEVGVEGDAMEGF